MTALRAFIIAFLVATIFVHHAARAHEIRPAALTLQEKADGLVMAEWKQPILAGRKLKMRPVLPEQCPSAQTTRQTVTGNAVVESWTSRCVLDKGTVSVEGLDQTLTDVFVQIEYANGERRTEILRPASTSFQLEQSQSSPAAAYLRIGAEHMLFGWDHLLFVLGLLLLTPIRQLLWVITAFTLGHSVTLAIVALGLFTLPGGPVELLIALSILFLAIEVVRKTQGKTSITIRKPWLVALAFGLLHGLGFAGALSEIGLPDGAELLALLLFNLGVELGQILFVALLLLVIWCLRKTSIDQMKWVQRPAVYLIGGLGAFYTLTRILP